MKPEILGVKFDNASLHDALDAILGMLRSKSSRKNYYVVTPNPEFVMEAKKDAEFKRILNGSDLSIPDGIGILWSSRLLNRGLEHRSSGADLVDLLLDVGNKNKWVFFFLGGRGETAYKAADNVLAKYPDLTIGCFEGGPGEDFDTSSGDVIKSFARQHGGIHILLVAYGQNKQEKWIDRNLGRLPVRVSIGVGGVLNYLAGNKVRAPKVIRNLGLEWLFRLLQEPRRFRRQLALPKFVFAVLKEKFTNKKSR